MTWPELMGDYQMRRIKSRRGNKYLELADNMSRNNAGLVRISKRGNVKPVTGGRTIVQELNYANNQTFRRTRRAV
jgi:hypothetical protein